MIWYNSMVKVEKAANTGFCLGVQRAVSTLEAAARERGGIETLGAVVHNQQVLRRLSALGVRVVGSLAEVRRGVVAISSHGVAPQVFEEARKKQLEIIDTTCPFVKRAQVAARRLFEAGFFTMVYGDVGHPEVKGILGWAGGNGLATLDAAALTERLPRRIGILSQTTQSPERFQRFVTDVLGQALVKDAELRVVDTICHDIRRRQAAAVELAGHVDLMLVIGGRHSANTAHLLELCADVTPTHLVETAADIQTDWLGAAQHIGVTSGASTDEVTINEVLAKLQALSF